MNSPSDRHQRDQILDAIADGVFTIDLACNITFFNHAAEKITGIPRDQAIGQKCFDVFRADICESGCVLQQSLQSGRERVNLELNILNSQSLTVPVSVSTSVLRDEAGRIVGGVETFRDLTQIEMLRKEIGNRYSFHDIVSKNNEIQNIIRILPDIAVSGSTVLIEGPSGTGKELFAKAIHDLSGREGKFVAVNCAALPESLLESELFGYLKGAFSGAQKDKPGRFELADKGTLFLDEVSEIDPAIQVKLLRAIQEKAYEPLGATATRRTDVRFVAATNRRLSERVAQHLFREDLYYRLNVVKVTIPPLVRRREDIPYLITHFISKFNTLKGKQILEVAPEAMGILMRHDFPGNVRELENIIEYAFVLCHGRRIDPSHLPQDLLDQADRSMPTDSRAEQPPLAQAEAQAIHEALRRSGGNRRRAAEYLGINKSTLWRKMKKFGITYPGTQE